MKSKDFGFTTPCGDACVLRKCWSSVCCPSVSNYINRSTRMQRVNASDFVLFARAASASGFCSRSPCFCAPASSSLRSNVNKSSLSVPSSYDYSASAFPAPFFTAFSGETSRLAFSFSSRCSSFSLYLNIIRSFAFF